MQKMCAPPVSPMTGGAGARGVSPRAFGPRSGLSRADCARRSPPPPPPPPPRTAIARDQRETTSRSERLISSEPSSTRSLHNEDVPRGQAHTVAAGHVRGGAVRVFDPVAAQGARVAAVQAEGGDLAVA